MCSTSHAVSIRASLLLELDAEVGLALAWMVCDTNDMLDKNRVTSASWKFAACF
jgi:hypothetical protein